MNSVKKYIFFFAIIIIIAIVMFVLIKLGSNMRRIPLENVRILIAGQQGALPVLLIEFTQPNTLEFVMFGSPGHLDYGQERVVFDTGLLSDFFAKDSTIERYIYFRQCGLYIIDRDVQELSDLQLNNINRLASNVARSGTDGPFKNSLDLIRGMSISYAFAIIDDRLYWCHYMSRGSWDNMSRFPQRSRLHTGNVELLPLVHALLDLTTIHTRITNRLW